MAVAAAGMSLGDLQRVSHGGAVLGNLYSVEVMGRGRHVLCHKFGMVLSAGLIK